MAHSVQLIIGRGPALDRFLAAWPEARRVDLPAGWTAVPVGDVLYDAIRARYPDAETNGPFGMDPPGLDAALCVATGGGGALAYVETEYFGGVGTQSGGAWLDGARVCASEAGNAINAALTRIGVVARAPDDAFDTIGLGRRRHMSDYGVGEEDD